MPNMKVFSYYQHPQETWDAKTCEKKAKYLAKDGTGTKYPWRGYIGPDAWGMGGYGKRRFNGGCVHNDQWYDGDITPLPVVAPGFKIIHVPTWGYRIVKEVLTR